MKRPLFRTTCLAAAALAIGLPPRPARAEEDLYDLLYQDDTAATTLNFVSSDGASQEHTFWLASDEDWVVFNVVSGEAYDINVEAQEASCDAEVTLYRFDNLVTPLVGPIDDWHPPFNADELISWLSGTTHGTVAVRVRISPSSPGLYGEGTGYRLRIFGAWGPNAGMATISGTGLVAIGSSGGSLIAGALGVYTEEELDVPAGALDHTVGFTLDDVGDIGNQPHFDATAAWLAEHPTNASVALILATEEVTFTVPATLTLQFRDDYGPFGPPPLDFFIDDLPPGFSASDMRIHTWNETSLAWEPLPGTQSVVGDTVTVAISSLGSRLFAVAPAPATSGVGEWSLWR